MVNGTRYSYWTLQSTGEKRSRKIPLYRCPAAHNGIPHRQSAQFHADTLENIVYDCLADYIGHLLQQEDLNALYQKKLFSQKKTLENRLRQIRKEHTRLTRDMMLLRERIPEAIAGTYPLPLSELARALQQKTERASMLEDSMRKNRISLEELQNVTDKFSASGSSEPDFSGLDSDSQKNVPPLPSWPRLFEQSAPETKRVLANRLIERIDVTKEQIVIRFRG